MDYAVARRRMVEKHLVQRGIKDPRVLEVMGNIPRHKFVEDALQSQAYTDYALPIGEKQTISQPYMVAVMTEAAQLIGDEKVLEIGTGSGYQAAVLSRMAAQVYSVERIVVLARRARRILDTLQYNNVHIKVSDGTLGWTEHQPYEVILVTAGAPDVPQEYLSQLAPLGRLVIPVGGEDTQTLRRITRMADNTYREEDLLLCRFVPLIGQSGWPNE
ncbi:MAG: protein-L-isoaspartate(D-aspartate) O-methyltransferase [Desulfuromonadaceae bacterium]|nr:protein-L-isoaspartate(D-aspartate) O-methyltransferase [Desulfuromonas sp.]MDY0184613.1 protein-L-isoaspartate(D-aspartate) O-methyltransferase [Desulfuromonadaceae bacterium]